MDVDELLGGAIGGAVLELLKQRLVRELVVPAPGAGSEVAVVVPPSTTWEVLAFHAVLTTSVVAGNRAPRLRFQDADGNQYGSFASPNSQAASLAGRFGWYRALGHAYANNSQMIPLPGDGFAAASGHTVRTDTVNFDAGDAYTQAVVLVREWEPSLVQRNLDWIIGSLR